MRPTSIMTVLLLAVATVSGASEDVIIRTATTVDEAWVGQRVRLQIDVLGADGWAQIKDLGDVEIPGTYILFTESQGTRLNETIGRTSYTGQRYEVSLFSQRPGLVEVPPIPVTVAVKQWGAGAKEAAHEMLTPATSFRCRVPPGAEGIRGLISTTRLTADQNWSSVPDTVAVGEAVTRSVNLGADDVSAMAFPPMQHPEQEGLGVYPGQPSVNDITDRGGLRGERVETVTYVFETPGQIKLPDIVLPWWDVATERLNRIELDGLELVVVGEPDTVSVMATVSTEPSGPTVDRRTVAGVIALGLLAVILGRRLYGHLQRRLHDRRESEAFYFKQIAPSFRAGDSVRTMGAIMCWLDRLDPDFRPARLDEFLQKYGDEESREAALALGRSIGSEGRFGEASVLVRGLRRSRKRWRQARRHREQVADLLPELNRPRG